MSFPFVYLRMSADGYPCIATVDSKANSLTSWHCRLPELNSHVIVDSVLKITYYILCFYTCSYSDYVLWTFCLTITYVSLRCNEWFL